MGPSTIARNYAETLLALARKHGGEQTAEAYARAIDEVARLIRREPRVHEFLATPRIDVAAKQKVLRDALSERVPELFLRFVLVVVDKRRQMLIPEIAEEFHALVDEVHNRVRAEIVLAREADAELQREIVDALAQRLGKTVVPSFRVDPLLVGGILVRIGDQIFDGSLRRRMRDLRRSLLAVRLPEPAAG
jgi:F-type H+-transporting ATPase subunit delta